MYGVMVRVGEGGGGLGLGSSGLSGARRRRGGADRQTTQLRPIGASVWSNGTAKQNEFYFATSGNWLSSSRSWAGKPAGSSRSLGPNLQLNPPRHSL